MGQGVSVVRSPELQDTVEEENQGSKLPSDIHTRDAEGTPKYILTPHTERENKWPRINKQS